MKCVLSAPPQLCSQSWRCSLHQDDSFGLAADTCCTKHAHAVSGQHQAPLFHCSLSEKGRLCPTVKFMR